MTGMEQNNRAYEQRTDEEILALCDRIRTASFALHGYLRNGHLEFESWASCGQIFFVCRRASLSIL
jgi:hypothetical protein